MRDEGIELQNVELINVEFRRGWASRGGFGGLGRIIGGRLRICPEISQRTQGGREWQLSKKNGCDFSGELVL